MTTARVQGLIAATFGLWLPLALAFPDGAPPSHAGGKEHHCGQCHWRTGGDTGSALSLTGLAGEVEPGRRYRVRLRLSDDSARVGGFQLAFRRPDGSPAGRILTPGKGMAARRDNGAVRLGHSAVQRRTGSHIVWQFRWRAPRETGAVVINAAAVAGNDDLSPLGDTVHLLEKTLTVSGAPE